MILKDKKFKYSQAKEILLDAILSKELAPDCVLPSEQEIRIKLGIGRNTLRTALSELEREGIISKQHGRPSRVNPEALRQKNYPLRNIAWVDTTALNHSNPVYFDIFRSVAEQAAKRNVKLDYIPLSIEAVAESFFQKQLEYDGIILGEFSRKFCKYIPMITHPNSVCVECPRTGIAHCIKTDCYLGGKLVAQTLIEAGYRNLAYLGYSESVLDYQPFKERFCGFSDYLTQAGIPLLPERIFEITCAEDENNLSGFLERKRQIIENTDGLFIFADYFAVHTCYALQKQGIRVPEDLAIIGFDGLTLSQFVSPVLTTIRQPVEAIGCKALEIVLNPSESASYPELVSIPPVVQLGATVIERK